MSTQTIFLACFPKSGSTYIRNLLCGLLNKRHGKAVYVYGHNEQDIFEAALRQSLGCVIQQHARGTRNNVLVLKKHGVKPLILTRNIFDTIISLYDHINQEGKELPSVFVHRAYFEMSRDEKLMFLCRGAVPWYLNFLASWNEAHGSIPTKWISYERFFADQVAGVEAILKYYKLTVPRVRIERSIRRVDLGKSRFNVGKAGRGEGLPDACKIVIQEMVDSWRLHPKLVNRIML